MHMHTYRHRLIALLLGFAATAFAGVASADPPTRVARLSYISGAVSFAPAGENEWVQATINRPLITGDRVWVDAGARAELQIGSAAIRMSGSTSVTLLNLDDRILQVQLAQGTLNVRARRLRPTDVVEVDTPNLALSIRRAGDYRIDVDPAGSATTVATRDGQAEVYGGDTAYVVDALQSYRFAGTGLADYEALALAPADDFDHWTRERDRRLDTSVSGRYLSRDVIGYEDLDDHGTWRVEPGYGNVWMPSRVGAGWAPYRDGHWAWVEPWGWTWIDDAPWGFAVSHYGRWSNFGGAWGWVPGPVRRSAVYAPALVAFVGGGKFQIAITGGAVGGIAWFPLGPRDVYRPSYPVSRGYFNNINTSNTVINNTTITNVYNNTNVTNVTYVNQRVPGAVVAVPTSAFVQSQPVARAAVRLHESAIVNAPVTPVAAVAPTRTSVSGAAGRGSEPPVDALRRTVVARSVPPAAPVAFAAKEHLLATNQGKPLDAAALRTLQPVTPVPARQIQVTAPTPGAAPVAAPPAQRARSEQRGQPVAPSTQSPATAPPPAATPMEQRGRAEPRGQPPVPAAQAPAGASPPPAASADPRAKSEQRGQPAVPAAQAPANAPLPPAAFVDPRAKSEQRGQPAAPAAQAPAGAPPAATAPLEPRGRSEPRGQPAIPLAQPPSGAGTPPAPPPASRGAPEQRVKPEPAPVARPVAVPPPASNGSSAPSPDARPPQPRAPQVVVKPDQNTAPRPPASAPRTGEPPVPPPAAKPPPQRAVAQPAKPEQPAAAPPPKASPATSAPASLPQRAPAGAPPVPPQQQPAAQPRAPEKKPDAGNRAEKRTPEQQKQDEEEKKRKQ